MTDWQILKADAAYLENHIDKLSAKSQEFARSLITQFKDRGLSAKQEFWVSKLAEDARARITGESYVADTPKIDLTRIVELFKTASSNLKKPYVLVDCDDGQSVLRLKLAPAGGRWAGHVYVYLNGAFEDRVWLGRVDPERMVYIPSRDAAQVPGRISLTENTLVAFAADPVGSAMRFGRKVGACCFCSRQLNDPRSITVGYGPICAENFGLPWGEVVEELDFQPHQDPTEELGCRRA